MSERLLRYKLQTALANVEAFARGGVYRAGAAVSTLLALGLFMYLLVALFRPEAFE